MRARLFAVLGVLVGLGALAYGGWGWDYAVTFVWTDDAYVEGTLSPRRAQRCPGPAPRRRQPGARPGRGAALGGDGLHLAVDKPARVGEHRKLVSAKPGACRRAA